MTPEKLPIPGYNIPQILQKKQTLTDSLSAVFLESYLQGSLLGEFVSLVQELLQDQVPYGVLFDSLKHLNGLKLTEDLLRHESWRIAGNLRALRQCRPVPPWRRQSTAEWMPAHILDCRPTRTKRGKLGGTFSFKILAGSACALVTETFWSAKFCKYFSRHLGFSAPWGATPLRKIEEFVKLRCYLLVEPAPPKFRHQAQPYFERVHAVPSCVSYNRELIRKRARVGFKCPRGFQHPCHRCWVGYDRCEVAVHPRTFVRASCLTCKQETWFDPKFVPLGECVQCARKRRLKTH